MKAISVSPCLASPRRHSRDALILFNARGLCVYANARPAAIPTLYNETLYPGM